MATVGGCVVNVSTVRIAGVNDYGFVQSRRILPP